MLSQIALFLRCSCFKAIMVPESFAAVGQHAAPLSYSSSVSLLFIAVVKTSSSLAFAVWSRITVRCPVSGLQSAQFTFLKGLCVS